MTDAAPLLVRRDPPLAWVVINRPAARNALTAEVWRGLATEIDALAAASDIRAIVIRGAGEQAFISGADISEFRALRANAEMTADYDSLAVDAVRALSAAPQPVIAMINGLCFGGGMVIALACDLRFAADHARFAVPATRLGLAYPFANGVEKLVHVVGPTAAADILLSARPLDVQEALRIGLVNRVVPAAELENNVREYALAMATGAPLTIAAHKRAIREAIRSGSERDLGVLQAMARRCFDSADYQEGIAAFLDKRPPRFRGA